MTKDKRKYLDRRDYLIEAVKKRRIFLKAKAIKYKGGKCFFCGYNRLKDTLEFHHLDKRKKEFGLSLKGLTRSWDKIEKELDKCLLVCANCHREIHAGLLQPSVETPK